MNKDKKSELRRRHNRIGLACMVFVAAMVGAAYASIPLYNLFCRTTGFGGTPLIAKKAPDHSIARKITVRFDGNVTDGLPWTFAPEKTHIDIRIGATTLFHYTAKSYGSAETEGIASYNISPPEAAGYFNKLQCFCFTNQRLSPGETMDMPVVFFIDPAIDKDPLFRNLDTITLSYTFFPAKKKGGRPLAAAESKTKIR